MADARGANARFEKADCDWELLRGATPIGTIQNFVPWRGNHLMIRKPTHGNRQGPIGPIDGGAKPSDLFGQGGIITELTKALAERALSEEMTEHLSDERCAEPTQGQNRAPNRRNGSSQKTVTTDTGKAVFVALAVLPDGTRDVLGLWFQANEGAKLWAKVLNDLRNRGVQDILSAVVDGLKGFSQAIEVAFPQTQPISESTIKN